MPTVPAVPAAPAPVSPRDPAAKEMYVIIAQLDALGVPAPECERVRMVLALMAQSIESGTVEWDSLRATLTAALEFPALAHRVMAVLRPFFEAAA
jgi:hypothetical protein